jgi:hypothetical protein
MNRNLEGSFADARTGGSLSQTEFLHFQQLQRLSLSRGQRAQHAGQLGFGIIGIQRMVRPRVRKSYGGVIIQRFIALLPTLSPKEIHGSAVDDGGEPWHERPARVVGVTNPVDGKQNLLDDVFRVVVIAESSTDSGAHRFGEVDQQALVSGPVAALGCVHPRSPLEFSFDAPVIHVPLPAANDFSVDGNLSGTVTEYQLSMQSRMLAFGRF